MSSPPCLTFDVLIATRNRPDALALSIPMLLGQSRLPQKLIVIDSSDDHAPVAQIVRDTTAGHDIEVIVEHSGKGLTRQRNRGLTHVSADIVFFPDDDSMYFPGTSEAIMALYERDTDRKIAGVAPADAPAPPDGFPEAPFYKMSDQHKRDARNVRLLARIGRIFTSAKPHYILGTLLMNRSPDLPWLAEMNALKVEWMTGYRMTYRREVITAIGFEPLFSGHSLFEDIDASFGATKFGVLVGTHRGQIYHHRFPSGRGSVYMQTVMNMLNLSYTLAKNGTDQGLGAAEMKQLRRKTWQNHRMRMLRTMLRRHKDEYSREELRALKAVSPMIDRIFLAPRDQLAMVYATCSKELAIN